MDTHHQHHSCCGCSHGHDMPRRSFLAAVGGSAVGSAALAGCATTGATAKKAAEGCSDRPCPSVAKKELVVQPVLSYQIYNRAEKTSWRPWGALHTQADVDAEVARINKELEELKGKAEFPIKLLPLAMLRTKEQADAIANVQADVMFIYASNGDQGPLEKIISPNRHNIMFVRHKSGPVSLYYETVSCRVLRKAVDELGQPGLMPSDIVVDCIDDVTWRMRALFALKNTVGSRIIAIGDASGWGTGGQKAPQIAKDLWKLDIVPISYDDVKKSIEAFGADTARVNKAVADAQAFMKQGEVTVSTDKGYVERAFMLTEVIRDFMKQYDAPAMTINNCMSTIMPVSDTTACLPLMLINDSGALAFCESDFVVIPSGILLNHICQTPVFLNDPTYPHDGIITVAHCTGPSKMDGKKSEKVNILTHYESDFGAAPKVEMRLGQEITMIDPDFACKRWIGFRGKIIDNPFMEICRCQQDVTIEGDWEKLAAEMCGFHWMMAYGDHRKEIGYALGKLGVGWLDLTAEKEKLA